MGFYMSTNIAGILALSLVFLSITVSGDSEDARCENIYKDFSDCVLVLGESMDNYQENVTSERGVAAVCSALRLSGGSQHHLGDSEAGLQEDALPGKSVRPVQPQLFSWHEFTSRRPHPLTDADHGWAQLVLCAHGVESV